MDLLSEAKLLDALERLAQGRTTFIIAHRLSTIRAVDQILVMDESTIVEQGRHTDLVAQGGLYARLYHQQLSFATLAPTLVDERGTEGKDGG